jgi:hypothetical protein
MMLLAGRHIYGKSHVDFIVETFLDLPVPLLSSLGAFVHLNLRIQTNTYGSRRSKSALLFISFIYFETRKFFGHWKSQRFIRQDQTIQDSCNSYFPSTSPSEFHGKGVIRIDPLMEGRKIGKVASIRTLVFSAYPFTRLYFLRRNNTCLYIHKLYEFLSRT